MATTTTLSTTRDGWTAANNDGIEHGHADQKHVHFHSF
jgi:hypothetical protein